jgi:hypothetical protein
VANTLLGDVWLTSDDMGSYRPEQADAWRELRALRRAEVLSVNIAEEISITYRLDGEEKTEVVLPAEVKPEPAVKKLIRKVKSVIR